MPSPSPTDLARDAQAKVDQLRLRIDYLDRRLDGLDLSRSAERIRLLEEQVAQLLRHSEEADRLRQQVAVLEDRVAELKRAKDETEKRHWQFVYIFAGAMASLLVTVIVQLVLSAVKR